MRDTTQGPTRNIWKVNSSSSCPNQNSGGIGRKQPIEQLQIHLKNRRITASFRQLPEQDKKRRPNLQRQLPINPLHSDRKLIIPHKTQIIDHNWQGDDNLPRTHRLPTGQSKRIQKQVLQRMIITLSTFSLYYIIIPSWESHVSA